VSKKLQKFYNQKSSCDDSSFSRPALQSATQKADARYNPRVQALAIHLNYLNASPKNTTNTCLYVSKSVALQQFHVSKSVRIPSFHVSKSVRILSFHVSKSVRFLSFYVSKSVNYEKKDIQQARRVEESKAAQTINTQRCKTMRQDFHP